MTDFLRPSSVDTIMNTFKTRNALTLGIQVGILSLTQLEVKERD